MMVMVGSHSRFIDVQKSPLDWKYPLIIDQHKNYLYDIGPHSTLKKDIESTYSLNFLRISSIDH
jgi:hypothetical protein